MDSGLSAQPAPTWFRSTSCAGNATCVEVAALPDGGFAMRDGKDPSLPHLSFGASRWAEFLSGVRGGEFDAASRHV